MPRYFIDTDDGRLAVADDEGHALANHAAARDLALLALGDMARELASGTDRRAFSARVRTEDGANLYSASLALTGEWWIDRPTG